eukprot:XP_019075010.1 PREDICTED: uncharacterized protein LOC109122505 isoform X2 [Vitis vinifera]
MGQFQQLLAHRPCTIKLMPMPSASLLPINAAFSKLPTSSSLRFTPPTRLLPISAAPSRFVCKMNGSVWLNFNPGQGPKRHQDRLGKIIGSNSKT